MKLSHAAILSLILPAALAAQTPAGSPADAANPITTTFRTRTLGVQRNLAQAFDSIPESKFGYKPTPAQLTIGYIAQHLANDNYLFCNAFGSMKGSLTEADAAVPDSVKATWPKAKLVANLKESFSFCEKAFSQLTDASLGEATQVTFGGQSRSVNRSQMVLGHAMDVADHYSQIANYMRLNNMLPPSALPRPGRGGN